MNNIEIIAIKIEDKREGIIETVNAVNLGEKKFKIIESPMFNKYINYGTIIYAEINSKGEYFFDKVIEKSEFKTRKFLLKSNEKKLVNKIGDKILAANGDWEMAFGGIFFIHLPLSSSLDIDNLLTKEGYKLSEITD